MSDSEVRGIRARLDSILNRHQSLNDTAASIIHTVESIPQETALLILTRALLSERDPSDARLAGKIHKVWDIIVDRQVRSPSPEPDFQVEDDQDFVDLEEDLEDELDEDLEEDQEDFEVPVPRSRRRRDRKGPSVQTLRSRPAWHAHLKHVELTVIGVTALRNMCKISAKYNWDQAHQVLHHIAVDKLLDSKRSNQTYLATNHLEDFVGMHDKEVQALLARPKLSNEQLAEHGFPVPLTLVSLFEASKEKREGSQRKRPRTDDYIISSSTLQQASPVSQTRPRDSKTPTQTNGLPSSSDSKQTSVELTSRPASTNTKISQTGVCFTCRQRKRKCDLALPKCGPCVKAGDDCAGYREVGGSY